MGKKIELTEQDINHMIEFYESGLTHKKIGEIMGFSGIKVGRVLKEQGVQAKPNGFYIRILNEEQEKDVIQKYESGDNMNTIAKEYNCSRSVIDDILRRNNIQKRTPSEAYRTYEINDYYFDEIDNQDKAYMLGFFYADGCNCSIYEKNHYDVGMTLQMQDKYILDDMCRRLGMNRDAGVIINSTNKKPYARMEIMNKHMVYRLDELGVVPNKTRKTKFPFWMKEELYSHFVRGLLDGDGCIVHSLNRVTMVGSKQLMNDLASVILKYLGFDVHVGEYKISPGICYIHISAKWKIRLFLDWVYKDADMKLKRKYDLYKKIIDSDKVAS